MKPRLAVVARAQRVGDKNWVESVGQAVEENSALALTLTAGLVLGVAAGLNVRGRIRQADRETRAWQDVYFRQKGNDRGDGAYHGLI